MAIIAHNGLWDGSRWIGQDLNTATPDGNNEEYVMDKY